MNLGELQAEIGRLLNDPDNQRWSASVLTGRINKAQQEIQGTTKAIKTSDSDAITAGSSTISLDSTVMDIFSAYITNSAGNSFPIFGIDPVQLDISEPGWRQWGEGQPRNYIYDATTQTMQLVPTPSENYTVYTVQVRKPADLSASTDIPFDSNNQMVPYHMSIVHWVVAQCWMDDGTPEALAKSAFHKSGDMDRPGQYELQIKRITAEFDVNIDTQLRVIWKPQGGRLGLYGMPNKSYPFRW